MAYARRSSGTRRRTSVRRSGSRTSYRSRAVRSSPRRRATSARRHRSGGQTVRIEIVGAGANELSRPGIGMKPARAPRKAMF